MSGGLMSGGRMSGGRLSGGLKSYDHQAQPFFLICVLNCQCVQLSKSLGYASDNNLII